MPTTHEELRLPKWLWGVLGALLVGGISQGIWLYTQQQVSLERLARIQEDVGELKVEAKKAGVDRWTRSDHDRYATLVDARIESVTTEQARRSASVWRADKVAEDAKVLREDHLTLRRAFEEHERKDGHQTLTTQVEGLLRRVRELEKKHSQ